MDFETYLQQKKIDSQQFKSQELEKWIEWQTLFEQIHPESFTAQKKFLINDIRRKYHLKEDKN